MTVDDGALSAEFDTMAAWTAQVVAELGDSYALPAACRGSGSPSALAWLAEAMGISPGDLVVDIGSGVGGPAAWLRDHYRARVIAAEPMVNAAIASSHLFGLASVSAWSQSLPLRDHSVAACWSLGVFDTIPDRQGKRAMLREARRVLSVGAPLGLLVIEREQEELIDPPRGNDFPRHEDLLALLDEAGFALVQSVRTDSLSAAPVDWQARADRVTEHVNRRHSGEPAWCDAQDQASRIAALLAAESVTSWLIHASAC